jgi:curli biogenesis system outer membrane secretion channel CsgG
MTTRFTMYRTFSYRLILLALASVISLTLMSCASVSTERRTSSFEKGDGAKPFPAYSGAKQRIQVVQINLPKTIAEQYGELREKRVGFGLANRLVETLYETNRFEYIEEKDVVVKKMAEKWEASTTDIVDPKTAIEPGSVKIPEYLVYAEVYDFAVNNDELVVGVVGKKTKTTVIGVQVRFVDVKTGEFVPGSGSGEAKSDMMTLLIPKGLAFDATTVGQASQAALNIAVRNALERLDKKKK